MELNHGDSGLNQFPDGRLLIDLISNSLRVKNATKVLFSIDDHRIRQAVEYYCNTNSFSTNDVAKVCHTVSEACILSHSIDDYLDNFGDQAHVETCAKLAISNVILKAEADCMVADPWITDAFNGGAIKNTWYFKLFQQLCRQCRDPRHFFSNVIFITFNYDRCIEKFFTHAISRHYRCSLTMLSALSLTRSMLGKLYMFTEAWGLLHSIRLE